ncbi:MAG: sigma-70 family RNA polymerase sigma factor [Candidatus Bipolaricaulota bacterium]
MTREAERYFRDLTNADNEVLDREEERKLARQIKAGDREAKGKLVEHNLRLVVDVAKHYRGLGLDYPDLIQAGNLGLLKTVEKFDPELGYKFSTYAYWWIRQSVLRALDQESRTVKLPVHVSGLKREIGQVTREYKDRGREAPSFTQLAERLDVSKEKIRRAIQAGQQTSSLDEPLGQEGGGATLAEVVEGDESYSTQRQAEEDFTRRKLYEAMNQELSDRERRVLILRYGLEDYQPRTLGEVGKVFDLSHERIRQLEERALEKLKDSELVREAAQNI